MPKREYREGTSKNYKTPHKTDPALTQRLFERWGIIGKRKERSRDEQDAMSHHGRTSDT